MDSFLWLMVLSRNAEGLCSCPLLLACCHLLACSHLHKTVSAFSAHSWVRSFRENFYWPYQSVPSSLWWQVSTEWMLFLVPSSSSEGAVEIKGGRVSVLGKQPVWKGCLSFLTIPNTALREEMSRLSVPTSSCHLGLLWPYTLTFFYFYL